VTASVLEVRDLRVYFDTEGGTVKAVDGVSLRLAPGERLAIVGESGSGKTTLAMALLRLTRPPGRIAGGQILLEGRDLVPMGPEEIRQQRLARISLVPQGAMNALNPILRIEHQILDGLRGHGMTGTREMLRRRVLDLLGTVGLPAGTARQFPHELSGGMKQRVALAIAISGQPRVIVADEPTSALDVIVQRQVMQTLGRLQRALGAAVVLVGHDMGLVAQFADRIGVMYAGRLVELGSVRQVLTAPLHPYTRLLIQSVPILDARRNLVGIPGMQPALLDLPPGCTFEPRCPSALPCCASVAPTLGGVGAAREVACHLHPVAVTDARA
jgi:peptide/nickel transport system ATP-binding protein